MSNGIRSNTARKNIGPISIDQFEGNPTPVTFAVQNNGSIVAGDINVAGHPPTATDLMDWMRSGIPASARVSLSSAVGTVMVGNIFVSGLGTIPLAGGVLDNYANMADWLTLKGQSVTVGSIDYSGYQAASSIDVHGYAGASSIHSSQGGSTISDNSGVNAIDLAASASSADAIYFAAVQNGVNDSRGVLKASRFSIDSITGFGAGDSIHIGNANEKMGMAGNGHLVQVAALDQAAAPNFSWFLANAEYQVKSAGISAYCAILGGNTYVAMNVGGHVGEIIEVMGSHTFGISIDASGFQLTFLS